MAEAQDTVQSVLQESRQFPPPQAFSSQAHISSMDQYEKMYAESIEKVFEALTVLRYVDGVRGGAQDRRPAPV